MPNPANTISGSILATDLDGNAPVNRSIGNPTYNPSADVVGNFTTNQQLANGDNTIGLPVAAVYNLYIRNLDNATTITVKIKINAGAQQTVAVLQPGAIFVYWSKTAVAASSITEIILNASGAGTAAEYFIGG